MNDGKPNIIGFNDPMLHKKSVTGGGFAQKNVTYIQKSVTKKYIVLERELVHRWGSHRWGTGFAFQCN